MIMSHIKFFKDITKNDVADAGGKGASLGEMTRAGIAVPPGFVVLSNAFDRFLEETDLNTEISARLKEVNHDDTNSIERASVVIRDAIHDHAMPDDLKKEVLTAFDELLRLTEPPIDSSSSRSARRTGLARNDSDFLVAVRSSATAEDSSVASWAGELETFLNTTRENVVEYVKKCWSSLFTPRAIFYRHDKKLLDAHVSVAVVIQKMVQSEISGITFTVHPVTEDPDQMIIEAGFGLGEAIVGGQITPDSYVVSKSEMKILDCNVAAQTRKLVKRKQNAKPTPRPAQAGSKSASTRQESRHLAQAKSNGDDEVSWAGGANEWVELSDANGSKQKLTEKQIIDCAKQFIRIENHYGFPCDIEWAMEGGRLYITQSRPITTLTH